MLSNVTRRGAIALMGGLAVSVLAACSQNQAESASNETSSSNSDAKSTASEPTFDLKGDGWGIVYPAYWEGKVEYSPIDDASAGSEVVANWNIHAKENVDYTVLQMLQATKKGWDEAFGTESEKSDSSSGSSSKYTVEEMGTAVLGSGQTTRIAKVKPNINDVLCIMAELPKGGGLIAAGAGKISKYPSDAEKAKYAVVCDLQSFGKTTKAEYYDEELVVNFLKDIAGYIYLT